MKSKNIGKKKLRKTTVKKSTKMKAIHKTAKSNFNENDSDEIEEDMPSYMNEVDEDDLEDEGEKHKQDLEKLKQSDPEFYKFLQENDKKLLDFNLSDEEVDDDQSESGNAKDREVHEPEENLEVASDESDYEADDADETKLKDSRIITHKLLKVWSTDIHTDKTNKTIIALIQAFHAALNTVTTQEEIQEPAIFKVEGSAVFNGVIQLCVLELGPAIRRFLGIHQGSKMPAHKCKKFIKIKRVLKGYFTDLLKLLLGVTSSNIQTVLLKHLHYMSGLLVSYPNITKSLVKQLVHLWGTGDDSIRVLAFFCILRITNNQQVAVLETVLKAMYMTYVKNCKFVTFKGLAAINFMRRSLVELFALDANYAYQHVFLYIRQLAIHLRNAITVNKAENVQSVYNWQFISSLQLWGNLLSVCYNKKTMQSLVYPFIQICIGTIKLVPTAQYYPLRFHVVQIMMDLAKETGVFIPVMPFLLEVLTTCDFNKKHQKVSMKPLHFTCLLRLSKSQLQENGFKDMVIETVYGQLLECLSAQSHTLAFPDLSLICITQIKTFLKNCKNPNYTRKFKQFIEKVEQNSQFIEKERSKSTFNITDFKQIDGFETQIKIKGTPLSTFFENWNKLRTIKKNKQLTNNEEIGDYDIPTIKRSKKDMNKAGGPVELFPSDSDDEGDEGENKNRKKRGKRGGKNVKKRSADESGPIEDTGEKDIVEDIEMADW
ncbi:unnamed protein product [Phaedon cochleariae]|uniref:Nucleolar complex protein 2 homolog n=1 Tax=Phaedon cochleariae TaxID=80249 RepID=A0A9N9SDG1_PHACE|nr:unnamed protein product [Phaedon cochleariae]